MPNDYVEPSQPIQEPTQEPDPQEPQQQEEDLVSRASGIAIEPKEETQQPEAGAFDNQKYDELLSKLDPELREQIKAKEKGFVTSANQKWQEAAEMRKTAEELANQPMTMERAQKILSDPNFQQSVRAMKEQQALNENPEGSGVSDDEWSYLNEGEKKMLVETRKEQMRQANQLNEFMRKQDYERQDEKLQTKYKNYKPDVVDKTFQDLLSHKVQATREHLWKVVDYDDAVKRAYQMGLQDRKVEVDERVQASTLSENMNVTPANEVPKQNQKESTVDYFKRLAQRNAQRLGVKL